MIKKRLPDNTEMDMPLKKQKNNKEKTHDKIKI
jgi:hypothetical protein